MLDDPPSLRIDLTQLTFEAFMSDPAISFLPPLMDSASSASASTLMNDCMNLFSWQHLNFTLHLAVVLRGQVVPATSKVNVELYSNPGTLRESTEDLDWHTYRQPLLPFHDDRTMPSTGTNQSRGTISVTATETTLQSSPIATTLTDSFGMFLFGPVRVPACLSWPRLSNVLADPSVCFKVALRKPGYEFAEVPLDSTVDSKSSSLNWLFKATKLSLVEVVVKVKSDTANELLPLQDVFVSLIGEDHRGNQFTDKLGVANFVGLVPGQYYLRAMMKEHVFHMVAPHDGPPGSSAPILVTEGISVHMELLAERVAFSVSGVVISLDQSPLENVLVEAQWLPNLTTSSHIVNFEPPANTCRLTPEDASNVPREQSWSDLDGRFLIRGLLPGCTYSITVHTTPSGQIPRHCSNEPLLSTNPVIDRTIPPSIHLLMPSHDAAGLTFIALPQMYMSTISIDVDTDDEFVPALHLTLFPSDHPQMVLVRHEFSSSPLFRLSGSLMSRFIGCELVALLEHSLDPAAYTGIGTQQFVFKPRANISEYHTFIFRPKPLLMGNPKSEL